MNNKLLSYDDAVEELKKLEKFQRSVKKRRRSTYNPLRTIHQARVSANKKEINILLSLIAAHKQARHLYGILMEVKDHLGMTTDERVLVDGALNEKK